ncbi:hypothetical protein LV779_25600 [Streptomyces thinghirensis]|nr:hypothetical protein [Streptomyces thinghirensis]
MRTIKSVAAVSATKFTLTLDKDLKNPHPVDDPVVGHGTSDLAAAISMAFRQTPPPPWSGASNWPPPIPPGPPRSRTPRTSRREIVVLANTPLNEQPGTNHPVELLAKPRHHGLQPGGDGGERIGVAMLDRTLTQAKQIGLNKGDIKSNRMVLVAQQVGRRRGSGGGRSHRRPRTPHLAPASSRSPSRCPSSSPPTR